MAKNNNYSDKEIISHLKGGGQQFEQMVSYLNLAYAGLIGDMQSKTGLSRVLAIDAYTDAILKLIRQVRDNKFKGDSKLSTYFYKIFYYTAVDISRKKPTHEIDLDLSRLSNREAMVVDVLSHQPNIDMLKEKMNLLGVECKSILIDWAYSDFSMKEIAQRNNLKNDESARSMKYKCLKKLKALMRSQGNK